MSPVLRIRSYLSRLSFRKSSICGSGVGLQCSSVGEPDAVIADLAEHASTGGVRQSGKLVITA